ncbi:MAG TPA: hypothetical protein VLI04_11410 [Nocardioidaceae bacterium]|nr:hypothetical protein [Nocardioidaceae bacterium]
MSDNERLSRELRNRADHTGGHPISFDDVKRSANKMKWQQRAATGAVAAVVLAIGIPVGMSIATGDGNSNDGQVANPSPTPTETNTPSPIVTKEVTLTVDGASRGAEPGVVYVYDNQIIQPDGTAIDVDYDYSNVAVFGEGWIGIRIDDEGNPTADVLGGDGTVIRSFPSGYTIAVSSSGEVAAFEDTPGGGTLTRYDEAGEPAQSWDFANSVILELEGILADGSVVYSTEGTDPALMVARASGDTQPVLGASNAGGVARESGLITGMVSVDEMVPESCWNLFDSNGALWPKAKCAYTLGHFNESEQLIIGKPSYLDSIGDGLVAIVDVETGKALVEYDTPDDSFIANSVWEDDAHVLTLVYSPAGWHILRLDTEGNIENVNGAALPGEAEFAPVQFGAPS